MKKFFRSILTIIILLIIVILYISYITNHNQEELDNIKDNIKENYNLKEDITYTNKYGNYYIFKTSTNIYVLNSEYKEILVEEISNLSSNNDNLEIIYKTNKLMYEKTTRKKNKIKYKYYDAKTGTLLKETTLERQ